MKNTIAFSDILEENGKTIKENNMAKPHNIPLGSTVEFLAENGKDLLRLYVVSHTNDFDGTPLYQLSYNKDIGEFLAQELKRNNSEMSEIYLETKGMILGDYSEDALKVVSCSELSADEDQEIGNLMNFKSRQGDVLRLYLVDKKQCPDNRFDFSVSFNEKAKSELEKTDKKLKAIQDRLNKDIHDLDKKILEVSINMLHETKVNITASIYSFK